MAGTVPGRKTPEPPDSATEPDVVAAGTVVIRKGGVLVVHRPKYLDWSFPKGKQDPGEPDVLTAVRETVEETGVEVRLGVPLPSQAYVQRDGRTKVVHYWRAEVVGDPDVSTFLANDEVDRVTWMPLDQAAATLTYPRDRLTLADAVRQRKRTTPLVILRHGKALGRKSWDGEDTLRPLNLEGEQQAREIRPLLAAYGVTRVVTSTSTRCAQTVQPYADENVLTINASEVLSEEHDHNPEDACALLDRLLVDDEPTVVCTHRPLLPQLLAHLGVAVPTMSPADMVIVHHRSGKVRAAELLETA
ncbi:MAG: hydrolase [Nocardioidaceae bacterium]|nr:hydrolase [Nocardioidaceae bacterium]